MISVDEGLVDTITAAFHHLLRGEVPDPIAIPSELPDNEVRQLITYINRFLTDYAPLAEAMRRISGGDLEAPAPPGGNISRLISSCTNGSNMLPSPPEL